MHKKKLHILFINSWYPSKVLPTNGDFIQRHAESVATKHHVTAIHVITDPKLNKEIVTDITKKGVRTIIAYLKPSKNHISKLFYYFKAYQKIYKLAGKFDIVHLNKLYPAGLFALYLKWLKNKKYIISEHFTGYLQPLNKIIGETEIYLSKLIVKNATFVCPVSNNLKQNMIKLGMQGNYKIIPNVVDTDQFTPCERKDKTLKIIHLSSLNNKHKNITGILKVISKLQNYIPDFIFYLIGNNPLQYQNLIDSLKINSNKIELIDQIPHHQVSKFLQRSDILVLFSNYENLPCIILEAFSCGVKVVATDVGGIKEFFPRDFGKLIPKGNEKKLLDEIINQSKKLNKITKNNMHKYATDLFSKESISNKFNELYKQSLKND